MSLKGDRYIVKDDISFFSNSAGTSGYGTTATRGGVASLVTAGSGAALDAGLAVAAYADNSSGKVPLGVLGCDVVNKDLTQTHLNFHKDEVQLGQKVTLYQIGWVVTNAIIGTPTAGQVLYLGSSGNFATVQTSASANPPVGRAISTLDEDGYAKVDFRMPHII